MAAREFIYQDRIVAFLDVLGFREKLEEFEQDAQTKMNEQGAEYLQSQKVNEFVNAFLDTIDTLDGDDFRSYLFSDNICIAVDYISNPELMVSLLFAISELFYRLAQKGYFLRGAIAVGKFIDERRIALGVPLTTAYLMESKDAVYPRILISDEYYQLLKENLSENKVRGYVGLDEKLLIKHSSEFHYLNVFYHVIRKEDKLKFFTDLRGKILDNLDKNKMKEKIYTKYLWLKDEYNSFLELYLNDLIFQEVDFEPSNELIEQLKTLKI